MLIDKIIIMIVSIVITHVLMSITIHNQYYLALDILLNIDTQTVHNHSHIHTPPIDNTIE